jgi:hypothetical protein
MWIQEGLREAADLICKDAVAGEDLEIFLFSNDFTITKTMINANLTEITTNGGEKATLTKASFAAATDADPVVSRWNSTTGKVWTITGALTVYGWAIRGVTSLKLYCAENWGVNTLANGNTLTVQPLDLKFDIV